MVTSYNNSAILLSKTKSLKYWYKLRRVCLTSVFQDVLFLTPLHSMLPGQQSLCNHAGPVAMVTRCCGVVTLEDPDCYDTVGHENKMFPD